MKSLRYFAATVAIVLSIGISARDAKKIYIIDGYFFYEIPMDQSLLDGLMPITTANGTKAFGLSLKQPLPEEAKKYAVAKDSIPEADILLEMYNEKKDRMIRFSVSKNALLKVGDKFPGFTAEDIDGRTWTDADIAGKVMVLNCWFTGCGPCRAEMPELSEWKNEMPDVMFFSSTYESPATARPVIEKTGFNWITLVNDKQFKEYIGSNGYPMTVVVDRNGNIAQIEYGTSPLQRERLLQTIRSLR